jgi:hypothetical protein
MEYLLTKLCPIMEENTAETQILAIQLVTAMERSDQAHLQSEDSSSYDDRSLEIDDDRPFNYNEITVKEAKDVLRHKLLILFILLVSASSFSLHYEE